MGTTIAFFVTWDSIIFHSNIQQSQELWTYFKISPGMPTGPTDFFLPIADSCFLIKLILMVKCLPNSVDLICGLLHLQLNGDT
jgi:hypothetical protein